MRLTQTFSRQLWGLGALALAAVIALPAHGQRSQIRPQTATCSQMSADPPHYGPAQLLIQPMARACVTVGRTLPFRVGQLFLLRDLEGEQGSPQFEWEVELLTQSTGAVIFSIDDFGQAIVLENTPRRVRARGNLNDVIDMQRSCLYRAQDAGRHDEIRMRLTRARGGTFDDVFQSSGLFAEWRLSVQTDTRLAVDTALCQPAPPRLVAAYNSGHLDNDGATAFSQLAFNTTLGNGESLLLLRNGLLVAQGPATGAGTRLLDPLAAGSRAQFRARLPSAHRCGGATAELWTATCSRGGQQPQPERQREPDARLGRADSAQQSDSGGVQHHPGRSDQRAIASRWRQRMPHRGQQGRIFCCGRTAPKCSTGGAAPADRGTTPEPYQNTQTPGVQHMKHQAMNGHSVVGNLAALSTRAGLLIGAILYGAVAGAAQVVVNGPVGAEAFGMSVTVLPNGNFVVRDFLFDAPGPIDEVGAVFLYRPDGQLLSTLTGSTANDRVGSGGITVLSNGNFVVRSPRWSNGAIVEAGAATFASGTTGISGVVSPLNSLVGTSTGDAVGAVVPLSNGSYVVTSSFWDNGATRNAGAVTFGSGTIGVHGPITSVNSLVGASTEDRMGLSVFALSTGNYVVSSREWDNGGTIDAGAVTFGSGINGVRGAVAPSNSLTGTTANDRVGEDITVLRNGNYVVISPDWDAGAVSNAGAATFGSGTTGISGAVSAANSLVGIIAGDAVGARGVTALDNGNYVVASPDWNNGVTIDTGAATFGSGTTGIRGQVSPVNSLVGSTAQDRVGSSGVAALSNGNYVVRSANWNNGATSDAGAATFGAGTTGISGLVSPANSLVGSTAGDSVSSGGVVALSNGSYVVSSPAWDSGAAPNAGAATSGAGGTGVSGAVSQLNSLVGSTASDSVSNGGVTALSNGNYVVRSPDWDNGSASNAGAATFGAGNAGISGVVSQANSLVGSTVADAVSAGGVTALSSGNYVVRSPAWDSGAATNAGAATFGSGSTGISGVVSQTNSLVGSTADDAVGSIGVVALTNGSYVVGSAGWDRGATANAGAATFGAGSTGISGVVSMTNSLVGTSTDDSISNNGVFALSNGNYVVRSSGWDNGTVSDGGAVSLGLGGGNVVGAVTSEHSVLGPVEFGGPSLSFAYDASRNQLVVGQRSSNRVVLQRTGLATAISIVGETPDPSAAGQLVSFTAAVTALPNGPSDGQVTFRASTGEACTSAAATAISAITTQFSCAFAFSTQGVSTVIAEYTGSIVHAYSGSGPEAHTTTPAVDLFANGFETP